MSKFICCDVVSPDGMIVGADDCPGAADGVFWDAGYDPMCINCHLAIWEDNPEVKDENL